MRDDEEGELAAGNTDGSVQAAALSSTPDMKFQTSISAEAYAKTRELRQAMRDADQLNESRVAAQTATATAQSVLAAVKNTFKDLTRQIEESKAAQPPGRKLDGKRSKSPDNPAMVELETIKRESSKLKLDIACILDEKCNAEKEKNYYLSRAELQQRSVEALTKEIAESNEEHVLVELARIEAMKECEEVEAQRREKAQKYLAAIQEAQTRKRQLIQEIQDAEDLEKELTITESDANVLASELKLVKEMDPNLQTGGGEPSFDELSVMEAAKKELESIKAGGFQLMASMDGVRREREYIREQIIRLKKEEEKSETTIQNLNSKLLRAKAKLEDAMAAEDKAKSIASTQLLMLEQLRSEADAAMKEHSLISEETVAVMEDLQRAVNAMAFAEDKLDTVLQQLKAAKYSETMALENLKVLTEKTMQSRDSASLHSSRITISRFEYEYLTGHAAGAEEIADMKVVAAEAWIEALRASEKELQIRYQRLKNQCTEVKTQEENVVKNIDVLIHENETSEVNESEKGRRASMGTEKLKPDRVRKNIKSTKTSPAIARQGKARTSASPGMPRSTSFTVKRRRKVMPNLAKFFRRERTDEEFSSNMFHAEHPVNL